MPRPREDDKIKRWVGRLSDSHKAHERWKEEYKVEKCLRYWKGMQRVGDDKLDNHNQERVSVNLIAPTVAIKIPSLYFYYPFARVTGSPTATDTPGSMLDEQAQLLQDTGNTIIHDPETGFRRETLMALKESMWGFGMVEIGYSADFIDNPQFKKPPLVESDKVKENKSGAPPSADPLMLPESGIEPNDMEMLEQIVDREQFFVKRIPFDQVRFAQSENYYLNANDWVAYYEWMYVEDIKASEAFKNTAGLKAKGESRNTSLTTDKDRANVKVPADTEEAGADRGGQVMVWRIWDLRTRTKLIIAEGHDKFLAVESFKFCPLYKLSFEDLPDDARPIPPITAMLGPQDEYNDGREMLRVLRKIIHPRYLADGGMDDAELRKLEDGGPGVIAKSNRDLQQGMPVQPVNQPSLDGTIVRTLAVSKDDFLQVTGVSGEARGQADSETATQASLINQRMLVRDSFGRLKVAEWLSDIIRGLIQLAMDKMTLPMWIMRNSDPQAMGFMEDAAKISELYRQITFEDLREANKLLRWDVQVDVETLSPLTEDSLRQQWQQTISTLANPAIAMLLSRSPELMKITMDRFGIRSARDQQAIMQALGMVGMMGSGANPNPAPAPGAGPTVATPDGAGNPPPEAAPPQPQSAADLPGGAPTTMPAGGGA